MKRVTLVASIAVVAIGGIAGVLVGGAGAEIAREHDVPARARSHHGSAVALRLPRMAAAQPEAQPETASPSAGFALEIVPQPSHMPASVRPRTLLAPTAVDFAPSASLHSMTRAVAYPEPMPSGSSSLASLQPPKPVHTPARSASIVDRDQSAPPLRSERTPAATPARNARQQTTTAALQPQPAVRPPAVRRTDQPAARRTATARTQPTAIPARERVTPHTEPVVHTPSASQPASQPATQPGTGTVAATPLPAAGPAPDATRQTTMSQAGGGVASEPAPSPPPAPATSAQTAATQPQPSSVLLANP